MTASASLLVNMDSFPMNRDSGRSCNAAIGPQKDRSESSATSHTVMNFNSLRSVSTCHLTAAAFSSKPTITAQSVGITALFMNRRAGGFNNSTATGRVLLAASVSKTEASEAESQPKTTAADDS